MSSLSTIPAGGDREPDREQTHTACWFVPFSFIKSTMSRVTRQKQEGCKKLRHFYITVLLDPLPVSVIQWKRPLAPCARLRRNRASSAWDTSRDDEHRGGSSSLVNRHTWTRWPVQNSDTYEETADWGRTTWNTHTHTTATNMADWIKVLSEEPRVNATLLDNSELNIFSCLTTNTTPVKRAPRTANHGSPLNSSQLALSILANGRCAGFLSFISISSVEYTRLL